MATTALPVLHSCTGVAAPQEGEFAVLSGHWESWTRECISDVFGCWQSDLTAWFVGFKLLFRISVRIAHGSNQRLAICRFELQGEPTELEATSWHQAQFIRLGIRLVYVPLLLDLLHVPTPRTQKGLANKLTNHSYCDVFCCDAYVW